MASMAAAPEAKGPDYEGLLRFLMTPLVSHPEALSIHCETLARHVWVRLALSDEDKGRVYGRGGRTIQAVRTVLEASALAAGQKMHLEVYDRNPTREAGPSRGPGRRPRPNPKS